MLNVEVLLEFFVLFEKWTKTHQNEELNHIHVSLATFLWDIGNIVDAKRGVWSESSLFAYAQSDQSLC